MVFKEDEFKFQHLESEDDVEQDLELMRSTFGQNAGVDRLIKKFVHSHPKMTFKNHFVVKYCGKIVATLNLIPVDWSIGNVPLKVAEMGCVATLDGYRRRGLMRRLINEYHEETVDKGYDLSVIEGIPYFYRQFGYDYALPLDEETRIPLAQLLGHESNVKIRPFVSEDVLKAMKLLERTQRKLYVHTVRDKRIWKMQQETGIANEYPFEGYAVEENDKMIAYFRITCRPNEKELVLQEATDASSSTNEAILTFLKETGKKRGLETLISRASYHDLLTRNLVAQGAEQRIPPYAWQIRITDSVSFLRKMMPLFEKRLAASDYCQLTERVSFNFRSHVAQMIIQDGVVTDIQRLEAAEKSTVNLNPPASSQLLLGYRSREELRVCHPDFSVRSGYEKLVDVLLPRLPSFIHAAY